MIPKEKAESLVDKFEDLVAIDYRYDEMPIKECQIECAKIVVDEIIEQLEFLDIDDGDADENRIEINNKCNYWHEVKSELEKLK